MTVETRQAGPPLEGRLTPGAVGLLETVKGQAWVKTVDHRFVFVNRQFARALGCDPGEALGSTEAPFFERWRVTEFRKTDRAAVERGSAILVKERGDDEEGPWFETLKVPLSSGSGEPLATVAIAWEVTPWERIERARAWSAGPPDTSGRGTEPQEWLVRAADGLVAGHRPGNMIREISRGLGVCPETLTRAFKRAFGGLPSVYRRWSRVSSARHLILGEGLGLAEAAVEAGFTDQSHMTRELKQMLGITPGALRRLGDGRLE